MILFVMQIQITLIFQLLLMKKLYVQILQILTVFIYSLFYFNILAFFSSLLLVAFALKPTLSNRQIAYTNLNTFILILSLLGNFGYRFIIIITADERINLIMLIDLGMALLVFFEYLLMNKNVQDKITIVKRYLIPPFLVCLSFIVRYDNLTIEYCEVGFFSLACFVFRIKSDKIQKIFIFIVKILIILQSLDLYNKQQNIIAICIKFLVIFLGQLIISSHIIHQTQLQQPLIQEIQMKPIMNSASPQSNLSNQIHQPVQINVQNSEIRKINHQNNLQALNIVLLVPFFLLPQSLLQIPLYLYMIVLQYTHPYKLLRYLMYITINSLYIINFDKQKISQILSLSIILIMNLQLNIESQLIKLQALWLRWCFILILGVLFWFGLREVNIFHLVLMIILLLFVTRGSQSGKKSFRNRNWKYLLLLFNIFTIVRYVFSILIFQNKIQDKKIYGLLGLSFDYNTGFKFADNFNFFPVLVNVLIVLQYWTYLSKVYNNQSKQVNQLFKVYIDIFKKIFKITTIIYYKTIVWVAYAIILLILILEQYSLGSNLLLLIILIILTFQICQIRIQILYQLWLLFERLIGILILLRYFFEFSKFQNIYNWIKDFPLFKFLYKYQKVLGLSIQYTSQTYFHTITKFQLMIALDMGMLLLSFLVIEYLQILIKVASDQDNQQTPKIRQIYNNFIDINIARNSLPDKLLQPLRFIAKCYVNIFYLLVTLYITIHFRYFGLPYIFIFLYYYYKLNSYEYDLISKQNFLQYSEQNVININSNQNNQIQLSWYSRYCNKMIKIFYAQANEQQKKYNLIGKVREILYAWNNNKKYETNSIKQQIQTINKNIFEKRIQLHKTLRKYFLIFTYVNFNLVYLAELIYRHEILDFITEEQILKIKWWYFIYGQIHPNIKPFFNCIFPFVIFFIMIIIEWKSCKLIISNFDIQINQQLKQQKTQEKNKINILSTHTLKDININEKQAIQKQSKIESSMKITLLLGISKLTERSYAMFLVYTSTIKNTPFSILYLLLAFVLNSVGTVSLMGLSNILLIIILSQYLLIILNYQNEFIYSIIPNEMQQFIAMNPFKKLVTDSKWVKYWTFGKDHQQIMIFILGIVLVCSYQTYYWIIIKISNKILKTISSQYKIFFSQKIFAIIQSFYRYLIIFSPLYITLISISLYISDYTLTNLVLCLMSLIFLYKQYLNQEISNIKQTRGFWKTYYRLLQAFIIVFMVSYCILSIPQYKQYCNQLLCTQSQYKSKIGKAALILLFQIGIDLLKSKEYENQMLKFYEQFQKRAKILRLAISFKQNDLKISHRFDIHTRNVNLKKKRDELLDFLDKLKQDNTLKYDSRDHIQPEKSSLLNLLLTFLPNLTDPLIMMSRINANQIIRKSNQKYMYYKKFGQDDLSRLDKKYKQQFKYGLEAEQLINQIKQFKQKVLIQFQNNQYQAPNPRYSTAPDKFCQELLKQEVRRSQIYNQVQNQNQSVNSNQNQKKTVVYQLFIYAFISNWQYLIYLFMIIQHICNNGILTLYYPFAVFCFGLVQQYQANKFIWMTTYLYTLSILILKYLIGLEILIFTESQIHLLIGHNTENSILQFFLFMFILIQVLFLQTIGLYNQMISLVEPVKIAIVRHFIQNQDPEVDIALFKMLEDTKYLAKKFIQTIFYKSAQKKGYDYSTLVTTIQIISLVYTFLFYDRMFIENKISFYQMIQYNQFTGGMVIWVLIQLGIMLLDRFISILNLRGYSDKWDLTLISKYLLLLFTIIIIHYFIMIYIPSTNQFHEQNQYALIFYIIYCFYFLISALQVRDGIDQMSRGFMDRYVWYNGYVYLVFRSIPFIFQFKVFSDWFVTKTVMRLFDWIKFEDLFGRLFVAKCNSLFLQGKVMGSKIEWWKKLLMGFPLLLCILAFIFGPLILFSNLNPLAQLNQITGGSIQLTLKINHSNQYPLYINSHINDIHTVTQTQLKNDQLIQIIQNYNIDSQSVQIVNLQEYSDIYWEISEGSQRKLLQQPNDSIYQLVLTIKFQRKYTLNTPLYILNSIILPFQKIDDFKKTLNTTQKFRIDNFYDDFLRLDNNNGLHILTRPKRGITLYAELGQKIAKKYWVIEGGLSFAIVSDKYSKAIFGYSVMGFYISIILVVANYFRFIFQGGANLIVLSDIPTADPLLILCQSVYLSRLEEDLETEDKLFWTLIDLVRSPDTIKVITGNYLEARKLTLNKKKQNLYIIQEEQQIKQKAD